MAPMRQMAMQFAACHAFAGINSHRAPGQWKNAVGGAQWAAGSDADINSVVGTVLSITSEPVIHGRDARATIASWQGRPGHDAKLDRLVLRVHQVDLANLAIVSCYYPCPLTTVSRENKITSGGGYDRHGKTPGQHLPEERASIFSSGGSGDTERAYGRER